MKCQICGRENASIHIREIKDGKNRSYYICKECAAKQGGSVDIMGLAKLIHDLTNSLSKLPPPSRKIKRDPASSMAKEERKSNQETLSPLFPSMPDMAIFQELFGGETEDNKVSAPVDESFAEEKEETIGKALRCSCCGWGAEQLKKTSRLGCPHCYKVFTSFLTQELKKKHRGTLHAGKCPGDLDPALVQEVEKSRQMCQLVKEKNRDLERLQSMLENAVKQEEYEEAALLRDKIKGLLAEMNGNLFSQTPEKKKSRAKKSRNGGKDPGKALPEQ